IMGFTGPISLQRREAVYPGEWPRVFATKDPLGGATTHELGAVYGGEVRVKLGQGPDGRAADERRRIVEVTPGLGDEGRLLGIADGDAQFLEKARIAPGNMKRTEDSRNVTSTTSRVWGGGRYGREKTKADSD
ncbi:MAG: hypothetical protein MUP13_01000, partial [Thermoanaerobaculales bacterium]|nr:hypothetical protein [Thermoanaerobaculales bacterium]